MTESDTFELYDLEVHVEGDPDTFVCRHRPGPAFAVEGEDLVFSEGGRFSFYALGAPDCSKRLDDDRRRHRLPRSELRGEIPHRTAREAHVLPRRLHGRAAREPERGRRVTNTLFF